MMYKLSLFYQGGSYHAILKDVSIINGTVYATQVGTLNGLGTNGELEFISCEPRKTIVGGNAFNLVEYKEELK